jgi:hypothetical protein
MIDRPATTPALWVSSMAVVLNQWFSDYDAARTYRVGEGGFLLPYGGQYFVTSAEAIRGLGLEPGDPDWERIGWDWVRPADTAAWERLRAKRALAA